MNQPSPEIPRVWVGEINGKGKIGNIMVTKYFAESLKYFVRSPLGVIALFITLIYGFATLTISLGNNLKEHIEPLIWFLVVFPVLVFLGFLWLVTKHFDKIYGPSDFENNRYFLLNKLLTIVPLYIANRKDTINNGHAETMKNELESIINMLYSIKQNKRNVNWKNRVLWVDDRPENNIYERKAFESQGIEFSLALSTNDALNMLRNNKYAAIISDMGRKEGEQEGYALLDSIRKSGNKTPFFIYSGSDSLESKAMAKSKGAQGSTNQAQALYQMVMKTLENS